MYFMNPLLPTSLRLPRPNKPSQFHVVLGLLGLPPAALAATGWTIYFNLSATFASAELAQAASLSPPGAPLTETAPIS